MSEFISTENDNTEFRGSRIPPTFEFMPFSTTGWDETTKATDAFTEVAKDTSTIWTETTKPTDAFTEVPKDESTIWTEVPRTSDAFSEEE